MAGSKSKTPTRKRGSIEVVDAKAAVDLATAQSYSENVFLFVPNLIGYARVILAALSMQYMNYHPKYSTIAYGVSQLLDAVDGHAARALGQASKFGAVLDMVTDRATTSCLLCYLCSVYPSYALLFQFLIALDFSSHYFHMYSSLVTGSRSHKTVTSDVSWILWMYYNNSMTLFLMCFGNELFFVALYLTKWVHTPIQALLLLSSHPVISEITWPIDLSSYVARITWPILIAIFCFPISLMKNIINIVQLWKASKILVGVDLAERAERAERAREDEEKKKPRAKK